MTWSWATVFKGGIKPGAMPPLHRYFGNPALSGLGKWFFKCKVSDFQCGLRGFNRETIMNLGLRTKGMEFASEMVVSATMNGLNIAEVPTMLHPDGRMRKPHLRTWRDGWRYLRFLLMYSPRWLFFYPGLTLIALGLLSMGILMPGPVKVGKITFDFHTLLLSGTAIILGTQAISLAVLTKQFAISVGLVPVNRRFMQLVQKVSLENLLVLGTVILLVGVGGIIYSVIAWGRVEFGPLAATHMMRLLVPAITCAAVGFQIIVSGFFKGILDLNTELGSR